LKKIGITGGSGLLGKLLIKELKKVNTQYSKFNKNITNKKHVDEWLVKNKSIEYIFHFAAYTSVTRSNANMAKAYKVNVLGVENLINSIHKSKKKITVFFASSSHVYKYSKKPIKETHKLIPTSYYGKTKLLAENKIRRTKNENFNYFIARIFSVFHIRQKKPFLYPSIKDKLKSTKSKKIYVKNANNIRDFLNAEKIVKIIFKVYKKKLIGTYNIGSGKEMTVKDFIKKNIDKNINVVSNIKTNSLVANINKLKKAL
jgi:nucleoside-diphosphate-sugar epimerase